MLKPVMLIVMASTIGSLLANKGFAQTLAAVKPDARRMAPTSRGILAAARIEGRQ